MGRTEKFRGSRTHGRGAKAGRGAGLRGGRGNAGLHKHKYNWTVKNAPDHFGSNGFKRDPSLSTDYESINVGQLQEHLEKFVADGVAKSSEGGFEINLSNLEIEKLLGSGNVKSKITVTVARASQNAIKKIEEAGGSVTLTVSDEEE